MFSGGNDGLPSVDECDNLIKIIIRFESLLNPPKNNILNILSIQRIIRFLGGCKTWPIGNQKRNKNDPNDCRQSRAVDHL